MNVLRATDRNALAQASAQFFGSRWRIGETFEQRAQIQARASGQNRQLAAARKIFKPRQSKPPVIAGGENVGWFDEIDQMVGNSLLLSRRNFRRADVEVTIDLRGIADEDFGVKLLGERDAECGLPGGGGPQDNGEPRKPAHPGSFQKPQYRSSRTSNTKAASRRAPTT